jgi:hypothetical protein
MNVDQINEKHERDMDAVAQRVGRCEERLSIIETLGKGWESRLSDVYTRLGALSDEVRAAQFEMRKAMDYVGGLLRGHIDQEREDREKLLRAALWALLGGLASVLGWVFTLVWQRLPTP